MPSVGLREYTIRVPGIPAEDKSLAERDIGRWVDVVAAAANALGVRFLLKSICVTNRFEEEVNRLLRERSGLAGYSAVRSSVHAIGKTLWVRSQPGDLGFAVLIDASEVDSWRDNNARCVTTILHELSHVLYEERHLRRLGEDEYTAGANTRERWLDRWATTLLDEFDVNRLVDTLLRQMASRGDGRHWSLRELEEAQGLDWGEGLRDALRRVPHSVDEWVWKYRVRQVAIDDLTDVVIPEINDLLVLLTHTASRYTDTDRWPGMVRDITGTEASRRLLGEHLDTILGVFSDRNLPLDESIHIVARAIEGVFANCGLRFRTVREGVYVSVDAPSP